MSLPRRPVNHNHFALLFVAVAWLFLCWLTAGSEIPLAELTGVAVHRVSLFLGVVFSTLFFLGSTRYEPIEEAKANPLAMAVIVAGLIIGTALVIAH